MTQMSRLAKSYMTKQTQLSRRNPQKTERSKSSLSSKCVSQICTCGLHRCPKIREVPFTATTTNNQFYRPYKITKQPTDYLTHSPIKQQKHYDPNLLQTTYNTQFTKKKARPDNNDYTPQRILYYQPKTKFQGQTEYNTKYLRNKLKTQPEYEERINITPRKTAKFMGHTQYQLQFYKKPIIENGSIEKKDFKEYKSNKNVPFNATTTYDEQYRPYKIRAVNQDNRSVSPIRNKIPFKGSTEYDNMYHAYPALAYSRQRKCDIDQLPPYPTKLHVGQDHMKYSYKKKAWK